MTETAEMAEMTETAKMSGMAEITETTEITGTAEMTETAEMTGTTEMAGLRIVPVSAANSGSFYALLCEYLPGSEPQTVREQARRYPEAALVLECAGRAAGVAFGWPGKGENPERKNFQLDGIAVSMPYQRRGLGSRLLRAFEQAAVRYGCNTISLGSAGGAAERFYLKNGYRPVCYKIYEGGAIRPVKRFADVGDYERYRRPDAEGFVVMEKDLG